MNKQLKSGFIFTTIGVYSNFLLQIVLNMIMSRLLTPKDYGVVAIMQVFVLFFSMLIEAGMGPAIIQNKSLSNIDNSVLFNYSVIFSIVLAAIFGFFGIALSSVYDNEIYIKLTWLFSISIFFSGLNIVPTAILNKTKKFKAVNFSIVLGNFCGGIIGITFAFLGMGVYALIYSTIISSFCALLLNLRFSKIKFINSFSSSPIKEIWNFSKNQFMFNFINYFSRNSDNILIGKFLGAYSLAEYNKAYQLLMVPNTLFLGIVNPVLQPVLSEYQDDVEYIKNTYLKIIHLLALLGVPLSIFLSLSSKEIIFFMFGNQWGNSVQPFSILALTVWIQMTLSSSGAIYQARNHSKLLLINGYITGGVLVCSIIIGIVLGSINFVAYCLGIGFLLNFFIGFYMLNKYTIFCKFKTFMHEFLSPFMLGIIVFGCLITVNQISINSIFLKLLAKGIIFLVVVFTYILNTQEKENIKLILRK
ncbi:lipopolysaccharide biosynthesis protein [Lactococcus lactis]|uniref:lipopolysaccharide biosynthesis protein n=1 Tax=Lactococcus lactis TaxID=1358 RepID=UPI003D1862FD